MNLVNKWPSKFAEEEFRRRPVGVVEVTPVELEREEGHGPEVDMVDLVNTRLRRCVL